MRNVTDSPDAAKKALIFKVPMDFKQTAASPSQMNLPDLSRLSRDDIFAGWGVALSTVGVTSPRGLNAGNIPKFEEAATWQNAREPRLDGFAETLQPTSSTATPRWVPTSRWSWRRRASMTIPRCTTSPTRPRSSR